MVDVTLQETTSARRQSDCSPPATRPMSVAAVNSTVARRQSQLRLKSCNRSRRRFDVRHDIRVRLQLCQLAGDVVEISLRRFDLAHSRRQPDSPRRAPRTTRRFCATFPASVAPLIPRSLRGASGRGVGGHIRCGGFGCP